MSALETVLLLLWIPPRQRPGIGTIANVMLIGTAGGLYIGAGLGPRPRDGLMTGVVRLGNWPSARARTGIELVVLALGWGLGGTAGVGTVLYALSVGPLLGIFQIAGRPSKTLSVNP